MTERQKPAESSEAEEPASPLDLGHLARHTSGEPSLESEVLTLFGTQSGVYLGQLKGADSGKAWQEAAHSLKGSAKAVGAWRVAEAAERAEMLSENAPPALRNIHVRRIGSALDEVKGYIGAHLARRPSAAS